MGDPRKLKKKYKTPIKPFDKARSTEEMAVLGKYGLRNHKEIWRHQSQLRKYRKLARQARSLSERASKIQLQQFQNALGKLGIVKSDASFDDILSIKLDDFMERRIQTLVYKKGLAASIYQARQMIVHRHIAVNNKIITSPSHLVKIANEESMGFAPNSSLLNKKSAVAVEESN